MLPTYLSTLDYFLEYTVQTKIKIKFQFSFKKGALNVIKNVIIYDLILK